MGELAEEYLAQHEAEPRTVAKLRYGEGGAGDWASARSVGFTMAWAVLLVFAVRELGIGAGTAGLVLSVGEIGGLAGALLATRAMSRLGVGPAILASGAVFAPALVILALAPAEFPLPFLAAGWAALSLANVVYNTATVSLRQASCRYGYRGAWSASTAPSCGAYRRSENSPAERSDCEELVLFIPRYRHGRSERRSPGHISP